MINASSKYRCNPQESVPSCFENDMLLRNDYPQALLNPMCFFGWSRRGCKEKETGQNGITLLTEPLTSAGTPSILRNRYHQSFYAFSI